MTTRQPTPGVHENFAAELTELAETCPVCDQPFKPDDLCANDIELGICHAACLEGSPVVDLDTGEPLPEDSKVDTFPYHNDAPAPVQLKRPAEPRQMLVDFFNGAMTKDELRTRFSDWEYTLRAKDEATPDWMPPEETARPKGFECLAFIPVRWEPSLLDPEKLAWAPTRFGIPIEAMAAGWAPIDKKGPAPAATPAPVPHVVGLTPEDIQFLLPLFECNYAGGARPVIESDRDAWDRAKRLSREGFLAIEQIGIGGRLHITRKGTDALQAALATTEDPDNG